MWIRTINISNVIILIFLTKFIVQLRTQRMTVSEQIKTVKRINKPFLMRLDKTTLLTVFKRKISTAIVL